MNRKSLFIASIALSGLSACKEKGPLIDLGQHTAKDSTYVASVETPDPHVILVEDFTGASCANCPAAHEVLNALVTQHQNRLAILGLHIFNFGQANPYDSPDGLHQHVYDFRTQDATDISNTIFGGVSAMPAAGFDRRNGIGGGILNPPNDNLAVSALWSNIITGLVDTSSPLNLTIKSSLNTAGDTAYIVVRVAYTKPLGTKNTLSVAITESNLLDLQEDPNAPNGIYDIDYQFNDVVRGFVSATVGSPILDSLSTKEAGRVFTRGFLYKVDPSWKAANCKVVAFVANAETGDRHVLQAAVTNLK